MAHNDRIESAIADLESQERPNIAATATKFNIKRQTLSDRYHGKSTSMEEVTSYIRRKLTTTQEEALIAHINKLSDRGLPPTPQIVKNLAEELAHEEIGKNWVARFCKRHAHRLSSVYLRTIDHKRKIADNSHHFEHYYNTVSIIFGFVRITFINYFTFYASYLYFGLASRKNRKIQRSIHQYT